MYLTKRSNGIYHVHFFKSNGKPTTITTGTKSKKEALQFLIGFEFEKNKRPEYYLKDIKQKFLIHSETIHSDKTNRDYKLTLSKFLHFTGNKIVSDITVNQVNEYLQFRIKESSVYQGRKDFIYLKSFFNWCKKMDFADNNPLDKIKPVKIPEKQPLFFTKKEFAKLCKVISLNKDFDLLDLSIFAVYTGLRLGELINLNWEQINFDMNFIILNNSSFITKSKKIRTIPLSKKALAVLKRKNRLDEFIFNRNGQKYSDFYITKKIKSYIKEAGINSKLHFHSFRHTFASWLVQKDVPIQKVSKLLGHADLSTTQIYAHLTINDLQKSVNVL